MKPSEKSIADEVIGGMPREMGVITFEEHFKLLMGSLAGAMSEVVSDQPGYMALVNQFWVEHKHNPSALLSRGDKVQRDSSLFESVLIPLMLAQLYLAQAHVAWHTQGQRAGWSLLTHTAYWLGMLNAKKARLLSLVEIDVLLKTQKAKQGGRARNEVYKQIKNEFDKVASEKAPLPEGCWRSLDEAIGALTADAVRLAKEYGKPLMEGQNLPTRVRAWLLKLPRAEQRFPGLKKRGRPPKETVGKNK